VNDCLKAALGFLGRDWAALAVCPPDHRGVPEFHARTCRKPGKRPLGRWKAWQSRLPTLDELAAQWELVPTANVGVALGPVSGLVGIDVDGAEGEQILREVSGGDLPSTLAFATARGTRLLYALHQGTVVATCTFGGQGGEVKVLGQGTMTVMPPSRHASGKRYRWLPGRGPGDVRPAPAPEWLWRDDSMRPTSPAVEAGGPIREGQRNARLFKIACCLRRHGCTAGEILAALRQVNHRCVPPLEGQELKELVRSAVRYPPAW
jgi:hypothetical protein